ncbi:DNA-directed RNA polymerase II core subunit [Entomortierella chlamydospora]|uniref:DNA-directed RNA polymerase II core subunit n=1 Tax=Entomortierella chlamydospora TaxID=101097 RepID=A0A9P6SZ87_9FUNG|nr:DNA-directed RNA polymerase II core subunit [Mortierella sp. AD010]KAF9403166.1 DNA-directed RNA polymerase II core subunit [Mortierella sp. AD011]KAF9995347.1 DNA-directed RNA polymerase II core subunit [Entomortierella chlamydospora]KAG0013099.1 DNA-directed RNA polymerase II core subunit [Entomortierella chlamydospora]
MNAPDRFELFVLPDGVKKLTITPDTKIPNAATFKVEKEDHTLANMLRMQLLEDPKVLFAGYKMPHPLDHYFILKVQTTPDTTPAHVLGNALTELIQNVGSMKNKFEMELIRAKAEAQKAESGEGEDLSSHQVDMDF